MQTQQVVVIVAFDRALESINSEYPAQLVLTPSYFRLCKAADLQDGFDAGAR